jgi:hypothetical protein
MGEFRPLAGNAAAALGKIGDAEEEDKDGIVCLSRINKMKLSVSSSERKNPSSSPGLLFGKERE